MRIDIRKFAIEVLVVCLLSLLFTFFAVYDSDKLSFSERLRFWGSTIGVGWLVASFIRPLILKHWLAKQAIWLQLFALSAIVSLPIPIILYWFDTHFKTQWPISNWALQYFLSFVIVALLMVGHYITHKAMTKTTGPEDLSGIARVAPAEKFLKRLPSVFHGAKLYAISSEDHYLRVYTDHGNELILMRLADALHELEMADGVQTHRSWWVARQGVREIAGKSGKQALILKCGTEAPIARSRMKTVRETLLSTVT